MASTTYTDLICIYPGRIYSGLFLVQSLQKVGTVATKVRLPPLKGPLHSFPKNKAKPALTEGIDFFSLLSFSFSLSYFTFQGVLAKQLGLAPKHNYENGPLGCFF